MSIFTTCSWFDFRRLSLLALGVVFIVVQGHQRARAEITADDAKRVFDEAIAKEKSTKTFSAIEVASGKQGAWTYDLAWRRVDKNLVESRFGRTGEKEIRDLMIRNRDGHWVVSYDCAIRADFVHPEDLPDASRFVITHAPFDLYSASVLMKNGEEVYAVTRSLSVNARERARNSQAWQAIKDLAEETSFIRTRDKCFVGNTTRSADGEVLYAAEFHDIKLDEPLPDSLFQIPPGKKVVVVTNIMQLREATAMAYTNSAEFKSLQASRPLPRARPVGTMGIAAAGILVLMVLAWRYRLRVQD
ncbi:MAG TPA: hypothetical protein VHH73_07565 [Verrucomicrobiae bacterium]|nr:hypothetical protein [Verrucomicrobiae bacterium]